MFGSIKRRWRLQKRFINDWDYRLAGIFDCDVDYSGKTILDAGCNIGIIDYEISKRKPASIHGIDTYRPGILAARNIFLGVDLPSRFDVLDLTDDRKLRKILEPSYDIVLFMVVWQHVRNKHGDAVATRLTATLAERCSGTFVGKTKADQAADFTAVMNSLGFDTVYDRDPLGRLFTYQRR